MNKIILITLTFITLNLAADSWKTVIPGLTDTDIRRLEEGKYTDRLRVDYKNGFELLPVGMELTDDIINTIKQYDPELCVEMLFVFDKPNIPESDLMVTLLNNIRAFSKQEGLEYYSSNRKKMYPLIKKSYYLGENLKKKLPDPIATSLPLKEVMYYYQKDSTFGSNKYKLVTKTTSDTIWLQMQNLTNMTVLSLFKAIEEEGQRANFIIYNYDDKLIFYALAEIKEEPEIKKVLGYKVNIPGSFKRRMDTIITWFIKGIK
ncbi:MAG: hypothetical protein OCD02_01195 [Spirochaetaceae bacterium]